MKIPLYIYSCSVVSQGCTSIIAAMLSVSVSPYMTSVYTPSFMTIMTRELHISTNISLAQEILGIKLQFLQCQLIFMRSYGSLNLHSRFHALTNLFIIVSNAMTH